MTNLEMNMLLPILRNLHIRFPRMSIQQLIILLLIGTHKELDQQSLVKLTGFSKSGVSKHIRKFASLTWDKNEGADFVRVERDPMNLNTNIISLTEKGVQFFKDL